MSVNKKKSEKLQHPSIFDVAEQAGVSHQTVSRVINHSSHVSHATRFKVQAVIDRLGYHPSNSARSLASHRSRTIGIIASGMTDSGFVSFITAIESAAREYGMFISVVMIDENSYNQTDIVHVCENLLHQNVDAFIFMAPTDTVFDAACRAHISKPRVIVGSTHGAIKATDVIIAGSDGAKLLLQGLTSGGPSRKWLVFSYLEGTGQRYMWLVHLNGGMPGPGWIRGRLQQGVTGYAQLSCVHQRGRHVNLMD